VARCKLFAVEEIERIVAELGRDHHFFLKPDGQRRLAHAKRGNRLTAR